MEGVRIEEPDGDAGNAEVEGSRAADDDEVGDTAWLPAWFDPSSSPSPPCLMVFPNVSSLSLGPATRELRREDP
jgi:hypothetical protein